MMIAMCLHHNHINYTHTHTHTEGEDFGDVEQHAAIDRPGEIWGSLVEKAEG